MSADMNITTIDVASISLSADGKRNAYHHNCAVVGHNKAFAVCCHLMEQRKSGRLSPIYEECSVAISKKRCPAIGMRKEEVDAGHAIYFTERIRTLGESFIETAKSVIVGFKTKPKPEVKSQPERKSSVIDSIDTGSYVDAINASVPAQPAVKAEAVAGESLMEMAKRLMANK